MDAQLHHQLDALSEERLAERLARDTVPKAHLDAWAQALYGDDHEALRTPLQPAALVPNSRPAAVEMSIYPQAPEQPLFVRNITPDGFDECLIRRMPQNRQEWLTLLTETTWAGGCQQTVYWDAPLELREPLVNQLQQRLTSIERRRGTAVLVAIVANFWMALSSFQHAWGGFLMAFTLCLGAWTWRAWFTRRWRPLRSLTEPVRYFKKLNAPEAFPQEQLESLHPYPDLARSVGSWLKRGWTRMDSIELNFRLGVLQERQERQTVLDQLDAIAEHGQRPSS